MTPPVTEQMAIPVRALVRAAWQESFNRQWRFSPGKVGLWSSLIQIGLAALVIYRLSGQPPAASAAPVLLLGAMQAVLFAFVSLFLRGRMRLYSGPVVQLIHLSPTPAQAAIAAEVLSQVPGRAWSALILTAALWPALPVASRPWATPALFLAILLCGLLGHLAGLLALIAWVRIAPQSLGAIWIGSMVATLGLVYYVAYLLLAGLPISEVAGALQRAGRWLPLTLALLFGLPGLAMAVWLFASPRAGESYREGWLGVMELGDGQHRPRRSRFPRLIGGPAGAVQALVWLMALRNWFSALRLGLWAACLAGITLAGPALSRMEPHRLALFAIGLGLGTGLLNYGEQAAALFAADGQRVALFAIAGVKPHQLLLGKGLAASPLVLVAALSAGVAALAARQPLTLALEWAGATGLIALCSLGWLVGPAAFDATPKGEAMGGELAEVAVAFEQAPTRPGGVVGLIGALAVAALGAWLYTGGPWRLLLLAPLPLAGMAAGYRRLRSLLRQGFE